MLIEDRFAGDREERSARRDHAVRLAAAEPEAVVHQISHVAHAMPERLAVANFVQSVALRARRVLRRHHGPAHDQLADFTGGQLVRLLERRNRAVADADDFPIYARESPTDTGPRAHGA